MASRNDSVTATYLSTFRLDIGESVFTLGVSNSVNTNKWLRSTIILPVTARTIKFTILDYPVAVTSFELKEYRRIGINN